MDIPDRELAAETAERMEPQAEPTALSPTLQQLSEEQRPSANLACLECKHAIWQATRNSLICYCRVMFRVAWSKKEAANPILYCDGTSLE